MCLACGTHLTLPADAPMPTRADFKRILRRVLSPVWTFCSEKAADILGVSLPDTEAAKAALTVMQAARSPVLLNHSLRTFVLGMTDARRRNLAIDAEAAFIASMLHDIALLPQHAGNPDKTFEENGALLAEELARRHDFSDSRAGNISASILLHAGQAPDKEPDIAFVMIGARQDVFGPSQGELSDADLGRLESQVPRLDFRLWFSAILRDHVMRSRNPGWTSDFVEETPIRFWENRWSQ